jgi:hypothetical protein
VWLRTGAADQNVFVQWQCAAKDTDSPVLFQPAAATLLPLTDAAGRINTQPVSQVGELKAFDDQVVRFLAYAPNRTDKAMQIGDTGNLKLISGIWY